MPTRAAGPWCQRLSLTAPPRRWRRERAWGRTLWLEMANHGQNDEPKIGTYGLYEDEFRKVDGRWLIARRNVLNDFIPNRGTGPENPVAEMDALAEAAR